MKPAAQVLASRCQTAGQRPRQHHLSALGSGKTAKGVTQRERSGWQREPLRSLLANNNAARKSIYWKKNCPNRFFQMARKDDLCLRLVARTEWPRSTALCCGNEAAAQFGRYSNTVTISLRAFLSSAFFAVAATAKVSIEGHRIAHLSRARLAKVARIRQPFVARPRMSVKDSPNKQLDTSTRDKPCDGQMSTFKPLFYRTCGVFSALDSPKVASRLRPTLTPLFGPLVFSPVKATDHRALLAERFPFLEPRT